jgi:hypothetical protein
MPIPNPSGGETEEEYIGRCMSAIGGEYEQQQALAICYNTYRKGRNLSSQQRVQSRMNELRRVESINDNIDNNDK